MLPTLPYGERSTDPPPDDQTLRFRIGLAIRRANPLIVAFTVALTVCMLPLTMILVQNGNIKSDQETATHQRFDITVRLCSVSGVVRGVLNSNPGAVIPVEAQGVLSGDDCKAQLVKVYRELGENATAKEKAQLRGLYAP